MFKIFPWFFFIVKTFPEMDLIFTARIYVKMLHFLHVSIKNKTNSGLMSFLFSNLVMPVSISGEFLQLFHSFVLKGASFCNFTVIVTEMWGIQYWISQLLTQG
jgi:hypothetical protein